MSKNIAKAQFFHDQSSPQKKNRKTLKKPHTFLLTKGMLWGYDIHMVFQVFCKWYDKVPLEIGYRKITKGRNTHTHTVTLQFELCCPCTCGELRLLFLLTILQYPARVLSLFPLWERVSWDPTKKKHDVPGPLGWFMPLLWQSLEETLGWVLETMVPTLVQLCFLEPF